MTVLLPPEPTGYTESTILIPVSNTTRHLTAIICQPVNLQSPPQEWALIAHGYAGHKDYCYQKILAHSLATRLNLVSIRFDFSSCGDSVVPSQQSNKKSNAYIRTVESDMADLSAVVDYIQRHQGQWKLSMVVGHSRGSLAVLSWLASLKPLSQSLSTALRVVNCAGRYNTHLVLPSYQNRFPNFIHEEGCTITARRENGQYGPLWTSHAEIENLASVNMESVLAEIIKKEKDSLNFKARVLSIYGRADVIVPLEDAYLFHAALNTSDTDNRHELILLDNADHNYFGTPSHAGEKKANYNGLVVDSIINWIKSTS